MTLNEALTRIRLIDPQLRQAGWRLDDKTQVRREIPVDGYDAEPWNGVTEYCLYEPAGQVLAVVEAKRCSRDRIYTYQVDKTKRLFVATEQTLSLCYTKFSPGFFDLIVLDEA